MKETELAQIVIDWLKAQHWEVWQEVNYGESIADIVAVRHNIVWIIETKTSFGIKVIDQARKWQVHYRSIAVPEKKGYFAGRRDSGIEAELAEHFKIGILEINPAYYGYSINEVIRPKLMREYARYAKHFLERLETYPKSYSVAGSSNGGYYTPYKQTMESVKQIIKRNPGIDLTELIKKLDGRHHYHSVKTSLVKALRDFERDWCEIRKDGNKNRFYIRDGKED